MLKMESWKNTLMETIIDQESADALKAKVGCRFEYRKHHQRKEAILSEVKKREVRLKRSEDAVDSFTVSVADFTRYWTPLD